jgi:hypothetical protein
LGFFVLKKVGVDQILLLDAENANLMEDRSVRVTENGYFTCSGQYIHRLITNAPAGMVVDHENRFKWDNRVDNLVIKTQKNNMRNRSRNSNNRTGVTGVVYIPRDNTYQARINDDTGKVLTANYGVKTHGVDGALDQATNKRKRWEEEFGYKE